ncbi:hypothetical protein GCM10010967_56910 [Dyadobacter beijingensis]|uniref:Transposase n=1 Tax=Dyadobacter beijingensis TaxID=365489 RepID=A0ABQ2IM04_9BACT|nr:hypothetical protein GCM10010967_56910 [Dyadobacter beijingensis]
MVRAIVSILKQQEAGIPIKEICWQHGIFEATFYPCGMHRAKPGGFSEIFGQKVNSVQTSYFYSIF